MTLPLPANLQQFADGRFEELRQRNGKRPSPPAGRVRHQTRHRLKSS